MTSTRSNRVVGLGRALGFGVTAWRDAWLVLPLASLGPAAMFYGEHGPVSRDTAVALMAGGALWSMALAVPLAGGLYRAALSQFAGRTGRRYNMGLAGLQWTLTEWRLVGLATLMFLLGVLFMAPAAAVGAGVAYLLRQQTDLSLMASLRYGAFASLAVMALYPLVALRVMLGGAATVAEDSIRLFQTWPMTRRRSLALAAPLLLIGALYPVELAAVAAANQYEGGDFSLATSHWTDIDAAIGAGLTGLFHGALMPSLFIGLLSSRYINWRPQAVEEVRTKPVMRVTADVVETEAPAAEPAVVAIDDPPPSRPQDEPDGVTIPFPMIAPAAERTVVDEDHLHEHAGWSHAAALQIGEDRIEWPQARDLARTSDWRAPTAEETSVPMPDVSRLGLVWPELELAALNFRPPETTRAAGVADLPANADLLAHHDQVNSLEHPMLMSGEPAADPAEPSPELLAPLEAPRPHFWWDADPEEMAKLFRLAPLGASAIPVTAPDGADPDPGLERPHDNVVAFPGARIPAVIDAASAEVESPEPEIAAISPPPVEIIGQPRAASAILDDARTREDPEHAHNPPLPREAAETEAAIPEGVDP